MDNNNSNSGGDNGFTTPPLKTSSTTIDEKIFDAFIDEYLKQDGVFLLRIVKKNSNDIVVGELVCALWDHFKRYPKFQPIPMNSMLNGHDLDHDLMHKEKQAQLQQQQQQQHHQNGSVIIPNGGNGGYHNL
jgi:hypothetical protein